MARILGKSLYHVIEYETQESASHRHKTLLWWANQRQRVPPINHCCMPVTASECVPLLLNEANVQSRACTRWQQLASLFADALLVKTTACTEMPLVKCTVFRRPMLVESRISKRNYASTRSWRSSHDKDVQAWHASTVSRMNTDEGDVVLMRH